MDFPSNSNVNKEVVEDKKVEKIISGEVVSRKKPIGRRFKEVFFGGEVKAVIRFVGTDVLLPAFRNLLVDASTKGIERFVYGDSMSSRARRLSSNDYRGRVQYNTISPRYRYESDRPAMLPHQPPHVVPRQRQEMNEIIFRSKQEAELVLERLIDIIDKYQVASVADLYDLVGLPTTHTDNKWGWSFLSAVEIRQIREGFVLELPSAEAI